MSFTAILSKEVDLAQNTSLRIIYFDTVIGYRPSTYDVGWIVDILSQVTSHFIERVSISIFLPKLEKLALFNLSALDVLFSGRGTVFAEQSTRLLFRVVGRVDKGEAEMVMRKSLPQLDAQGRLEFYFFY